MVNTIMNIIFEVGAGTCLASLLLSAIIVIKGGKK